MDYLKGLNKEWLVSIIKTMCLVCVPRCTCKRDVRTLTRWSCVLNPNARERIVIGGRVEECLGHVSIQWRYFMCVCVCVCACVKWGFDVVSSKICTVNYLSTCNVSYCKQSLKRVRGGRGPKREGSREDVLPCGVYVRRRIQSWMPSINQSIINQLGRALTREAA